MRAFRHHTAAGGISFTANRRSAAASSSSASSLSSSSHLFPSSLALSSSPSTHCLFFIADQKRFRSAQFGVKGDDEHLAERSRNANLNRASRNKKKEDLYEFTNLAGGGKRDPKGIPLGMDSETADDRKNIMKMNPLMILKKVEEDKGGRIVKAIKKIQGKPDSMRLTEEQQSDLVNAYAESKWFAVFWRPFANVNYARAKRMRLLANIGLTLCIITGFTIMFVVYYEEMLAFCELTPEEQVEYKHVIMHVPIGVVKGVGDHVLKQYDPNGTLPQIDRLRLLMVEFRRLKWNVTDWEIEGPRQFKPWYETWDYWHCFFWTSMWVGKMITGGGAYYSPKQTFGKIEQQAQRRREEVKQREAGFVGHQVEHARALEEEQRRLAAAKGILPSSSNSEIANAEPITVAGYQLPTIQGPVRAIGGWFSGGTKKGGEGGDVKA